MNITDIESIARAVAAPSHGGGPEADQEAADAVATAAHDAAVAELEALEGLEPSDLGPRAAMPRSGFAATQVIGGLPGDPRPTSEALGAFLSRAVPYDPTPADDASAGPPSPPAVVVLDVIDEPPPAEGDVWWLEIQRRLKDRCGSTPTLWSGTARSLVWLMARPTSGRSSSAPPLGWPSSHPAPNGPAGPKPQEDSMTRVRYSYVSRARAVAVDAVELWLKGGTGAALFVTRAGEAWVADHTIACAPGEIRIPCPASANEDEDEDEDDITHAQEVLERLIEDAWR